MSDQLTFTQFAKHLWEHDRVMFVCYMLVFGLGIPTLVACLVVLLTGLRWLTR